MGGRAGGRVSGTQTVKTGSGQNLDQGLWKLEPENRRSISS